MTAGTTAVPAGETTRRERQHQATRHEIVATARTFLGSGEPLSLRSVAQRMGMTAPALYRYVDSYEALLWLVADSIYDDVLAELTTARVRVPDDDPVAQIVVCAIAFRRWALAHYEEFGLLFTNQMTGKAQPAVDREQPGLRFGVFFAEIYERVWAKYQFPTPTAEELGSDVAQLLMTPVNNEAGFACANPLDQITVGPVGLRWLFMRSWARLYGSVTLEVYSHLDPRLVDNGALFIAMLRDNAKDLGIEAEFERLAPLVAAELHSSAG
jgi:AcrR family transcriptional regulator